MRHVKYQMERVRKCQLCLEEKQLKLSHVIPKFVFSWHKRNSPSYLRSGQEPNKRVQDGEKEYLFCEDCEEVFSCWEDKFSRKVFKVLNDPNISNPMVSYDESALKFAVSVSYRISIFSELEQGLEHFPIVLKEETKKARDVWRKFLLGEIAHPGKYEQHLMHLDVIEDHTAPTLSPFINRYFVGAVHSDMVCSDDMAFTYAKMFRVVIFGHIQELKSKWKGTRISPSSGTFGQRNIAVPDYVLDYMNGKANELYRAGDSLSDRQQQAIAKNVNANMEGLAKTSMFRASISDSLLSNNKRNQDVT